MFDAQLQSKHACQGRGHLDWGTSALRRDVATTSEVLMSVYAFTACLNFIVYCIIVYHCIPFHWILVYTSTDTCVGIKNKWTKTKKDLLVVIYDQLDLQIQSVWYNHPIVLYLWVWYSTAWQRVSNLHLLACLEINVANLNTSNDRTEYHLSEMYYCGCVCITYKNNTSRI